MNQNWSAITPIYAREVLEPLRKFETIASEIPMIREHNPENSYKDIKDKSNPINFPIKMK